VQRETFGWRDITRRRRHTQPAWDLRLPDTMPARILIVDDEPELSRWTASTITHRSGASDWTSTTVQLDRRTSANRSTTTIRTSRRTAYFGRSLCPDSVELHLGAGHPLRLSTSVFDDHDSKSSLGVSAFPAGFPRAAEVSFEMEWSGILEQQQA
jgi:hypothetical protein